jgi:hypothetical protein
MGESLDAPPYASPIGVGIDIALAYAIGMTWTMPRARLKERSFKTPSEIDELARMLNALRAKVEQGSSR